MSQTTSETTNESLVRGWNLWVTWYPEGACMNDAERAGWRAADKVNEVSIRPTHATIEDADYIDRVAKGGAR